VTRSARPNTPNNVLHTGLEPVHARANERLEAQGLPPIAHLTPHMLRRTFASSASAASTRAAPSRSRATPTRA
jgi:integrase